MFSLRNIINEVDDKTNAEVMEMIENEITQVKLKASNDYWTSDEGQKELVKMLEEQAGKPGPALSMFDYTSETKAMLSSAGPTAGEEWIEVELTADTGACDTVMPRAMAAHIPIQPSLQSLHCMKYEVADGNEIPNLGERRCVMWTENASEARKIDLQVADVYKPLLSLSRCADMGFESRFGRQAGALIDEQTGEVIPLQRKGNLYVLRCWLKAAPFARQETR